jgi:hypothetical protein
MGKHRKHPRPTPSPRSQGIAADYSKMLERRKLDDAAVLTRAQLMGVKLTQPTLSRVRTAALEEGASELTLRLIGQVIGEAPEQAFPSVFTTGDSVRDRAITIVKRLSDQSLAQALVLLTRLDEEMIRAAGGEPTPRSAARAEADSLRPALEDAANAGVAPSTPQPQSPTRRQAHQPRPALKR